MRERAPSSAEFTVAPGRQICAETASSPHHTGRSGQRVRGHASDRRYTCAPKWHRHFPGFRLQGQRRCPRSIPAEMGFAPTRCAGRTEPFHPQPPRSHRPQSPESRHQSIERSGEDHQLSTHTGQRGSITIAIINKPNVQLAQFADRTVHLVTAADLAILATKKATSSCAAPALLGDIRGDASSWSPEYGGGLRLAVTDVLTYKDGIDAASDIPAGAPGPIDQNHGLSRPAAPEFIFEIENLSGVPAAGASMADLVHGPLAATVLFGRVQRLTLAVSHRKAPDPDRSDGPDEITRTS